MKIRNIIFDCNGTMIFDGKYHDIAWRTYVSKLAGRELTKEEFQHQILGHTNRDIFEWLLGKGALSEEKIMQLTEEKEVLYRSMYQEDQDACGQSDRQDHRHKIAILVKGLPEFLDELQRRNIKCNIATASGLSNVDFYFERFALAKWFDKSKLAYDDGTMRAKPAPDMYIRAMERIGAEPSETMVIEDSPSGVKAAVAANAACIVGIYGDSDKKLLQNTGVCDYLIEDYTRNYIGYIERNLLE